MRQTFSYSFSTGKALLIFYKEFVSGELGMEDEAQYSHVTLMINDDHYLTGTPPFYIQHYHGTLEKQLHCQQALDRPVGNAYSFEAQ